MSSVTDSRLSYVTLGFFFNDTATTEIYTLSLHDALPICRDDDVLGVVHPLGAEPAADVGRRDDADVLRGDAEDRKSTRLNSSHGYISYAVFCLKKKIDIESLLINDGVLPVLCPLHNLRTE